MAVNDVVLRLCRIKNLLSSFCPELSSLVCYAEVYNAVCLHAAVCCVCSNVLYCHVYSNVCLCPVLYFVLRLNVAVCNSSTVRYFENTKVEHNISETGCFISRISRLEDAQHYSPLRRIFPQSLDNFSPGISENN
jgi:hypothetical protein